MIVVGKAGERIRWGALELNFLREGTAWRVTGSLDCLLPFDPAGQDILLSPILSEENYYIDMEPPVAIGPGQEARLASTLPIGVEVFVESVKLGDYMPRFKRIHLGDLTDGAFATFVRSAEFYQPGIVLDISVVNPGKESLCFDELILNPRLLSVFEHEEEWVAEHLVVSLGREEQDVRHTDFGNGNMIIRGLREKEINKRLKRIVQRLKDAI